LQVVDLRPFLGDISLKAKIVELPPPREVAGGRHKISEALVGDESGCIYLTLWDDHVSKFEKGNTIQLEKGYVSVHRQSMRLTAGKYGTVTKAEEEIPEVNVDNNLSDKLVEQRSRTRSRGSGNRSNTSESSKSVARTPKKRRYWHQRE
jgi:replication factor A1